MLAPTVREMDKNITNCSASQVNLTAHIDRLAHELEVLLSSMPEPAVELHANKIKGIRGRVDVLSANIASIQARMTRLHTTATGKESLPSPSPSSSPSPSPSHPTPPRAFHQAY